MKVKKPSWFNKALAERKSEHQIVVKGAKIYYQKWGSKDNPGMVLVHGTGSHSHWWDFIAPSLIDLYEVVAIDLSGMGESDHREEYKAEIFGREILSVAEDAYFFNERSSPPIICGHSLGGYMSASAASLSEKPIRGVIMIDSPIRPPDYDYSQHSHSYPIRRRKTYPNLESILERFRLTPDQDCKNQYIIDYIAKWSVQEVENGYQWKFDDSLFEKLIFEISRREVALSLSCPLGIIYGAESALMTNEILNYMKKQVNSETQMTCIGKAQHHVFLDQPQKTVEEIKKIASSW